VSRILRTLVAACLLHPFAWQVTASAEPPSPEPGPPSVQPVPLVVDPGAPAGPTATIPWRQTGRAETLELRGENVAAKVEVPIPEGVTASSVSGQIGSAMNITAGRIDVVDGLGTALGAIGVPVDTPTAPFTVNTTAAAIENGLLTLNFVLRIVNPPADTCAPTPAVTLTRLATTLAGQPRPASTVADFLPPYLDAVTIWTGPSPSPDEQQAALTLTAMLTRSYRPIPVRVDVDISPQVPLADTPGRRVITIDESDQSGIDVRNAGTPQAVLAVTGRGPDLIEQIGLFIDRRLALAQTPSVEVQSAVGLLTPTSTLMTFEQLGIAASPSFTGASTVYTGFDGAAFAVGPIEKVKVDLRARYTPTADDEASLLVRSGGYVLATRRLDQSGDLDMTVEIPPQAIRSDIGMALELQYFPRGGSAGGCAPLNDRMTFALDPQSTVEVTPGPADTGGFAALPAAFTPEFSVALDRPEMIRYAAQVINLISQRTGTLLRPQVVSLADGAASRTALLAVTGTEGGLARIGMPPPVAVDGSGTVQVDGAADTGARLNGPIALVQSFTQNRRAVLAIDVPDRQELADKNIDYIRGLDNGWSSLSGDVVATGAAGDTVTLTVRTEQQLGDRADDKAGWKWSVMATVAVAAGAAAVLFRGLILRRRQNRG
jgi:hypothetical protein